MSRRSFVYVRWFSGEEGCHDTNIVRGGTGLKAKNEEKPVLIDGKIKVLHVLVDGNYSGAQNVAINIIKNTCDVCNSVYVSKSGSVQSRLNDEKITFCEVKKIDVKTLKGIIHEQKPDIVHAHDFQASIIAAFSSGKIPVISHIHQNPPWMKKINIKTIAYVTAVRRIDCVLIVSDSVIEEFVFRKNIIRKCDVIGNPVDTQKIRRLSEANMGDHSLDKADLLFLGRLEDVKNPMGFIKIVEMIYKMEQSISAILVGDGSMRDKCESYIKTHGLEEIIRLYGYIENPYPLLKRAKVLCIPSKWEGFGLVAVEGLALGKPVVSSRVGGLKDIVDVDVGKACANEEEFCAEIMQLISDDNYYKKKSCAAIERSQMYDNTTRYYETIKRKYGLLCKKT